MKFLESNKLAQLTAQLTEAYVCERVINGRIEAFTMKRAGTDKKYAHALGEKYQQEIKTEENELNNLKKMQQRSRSVSLGSNTSNHSLDSLGKGKSRKLQSQTSSPNTNNKGKRVRINTKNNIGTEVKRPRSTSITLPLPSTTSSSFGGLPKASAMRSRSDSFSYGGVTMGANSQANFPYFNSPLGDFHESCTQRLMTDLILTLNASFPDYDFSSIRPQHFTKVPSSKIAMNRTNEKLSEFAASTPQGATFLPHLWASIDEVIRLNSCEVYSYVPPSRDDDDDPLSFLTQTLDGADSSLPLWSFNFFFVNKSIKRIVLLTCVQTMRTEPTMSSMDNDDDSFGVVTELEAESNYFGTPGGDGAISRNGMARFVEDEEEGGLDFDMDADGMNQAVSPPHTTVA